MGRPKKRHAVIRGCRMPTFSPFPLLVFLLDRRRSMAIVKIGIASFHENSLTGASGGGERPAFLASHGESRFRRRRHLNITIGLAMTRCLIALGLVAGCLGRLWAGEDGKQA